MSVGRCLEEFTVEEVGELLDSLELRMYKSIFLEKGMTGKMLSSIETIDQLVNHGIFHTPDARLLLSELKKRNKRKATGR